MWGSSFADLAKKAQEAAELASRQAQEASTSLSSIGTPDVGQVTSLFNLDSMLDNGGSKTDKDRYDTFNADRTNKDLRIDFMADTCDHAKVSNSPEEVSAKPAAESTNDMNTIHRNMNVESTNGNIDNEGGKGASQEEISCTADKQQNNGGTNTNDADNYDHQKKRQELDTPDFEVCNGFKEKTKAKTSEEVKKTQEGMDVDIDPDSEGASESDKAETGTVAIVDIVVPEIDLPDKQRQANNDTWKDAIKEGKCQDDGIEEDKLATVVNVGIENLDEDSDTVTELASSEFIQNMENQEEEEKKKELSKKGVEPHAGAENNDEYGTLAENKAFAQDHLTGEHNYPVEEIAQDATHIGDESTDAVATPNNDKKENQSIEERETITFSDEAPSWTFEDKHDAVFSSSLTPIIHRESESNDEILTSESRIDDKICSPEEEMTRGNSDQNDESDQEFNGMYDDEECNPEEETCNDTQGQLTGVDQQSGLLDSNEVDKDQDVRTPVDEAITESEYDNAGAALIPRPGDSFVNNTERNASDEEETAPNERLYKRTFSTNVRDDDSYKGVTGNIQLVAAATNDIAKPVDCGLSSYIDSASRKKDVEAGSQSSDVAILHTSPYTESEYPIAQGEPDESASYGYEPDAGNSGFEPLSYVDPFNDGPDVVDERRRYVSRNDEKEMNISMTNSVSEPAKLEDEAAVDESVYDGNDLDDMYESSECDSQMEIYHTDSESEADEVTLGDKGRAEEISRHAVPQYAIEKFMSQLERIHSEHETELREMEMKHKLHIDEMKENLKLASEAPSQRGSSKSEVANQDKHLAQQRQLEKEFNVALQQREDMISEVNERNEHLKIRVEELTLEAEGLNLSIQAGKERLAEVDKKNEEIEELKASLASKSADLKLSNEAFSNLKSRVKSVATELKDRRVECRNLNVNVQELTMLKSTLESENNDLQLKATTFEKLVEEKDERIEDLEKIVAEIKMDAKKKDKALLDKGSVSDKTLKSYKKKAQASLANANARAATANQAREDAEIDATNARAETCNALKAKREAEDMRDAAIARVKEEVQVFLDQIEEIKKDRNHIQNELSDSQCSLAKALRDTEEANKNKQEMLNEWNTKIEDLEKAQELMGSLKQDIAISRIKNKELEDEILFLKEEVEKFSSAEFMALQKVSEGSDQHIDTNINTHNDDNANESDGTIFLLQEELKVANDAIKDLKESLNTALSQNPPIIPERNGTFDDMSLSRTTSRDESHPSLTTSSRNEAGPAPLFFAFEKQAELNTANDEISRLAALLGDAESARTEAQEAVEDMRKKMEEAEARLRRYEKLGPAKGARAGGVTSPTFSASQSYSSRRQPGKPSYHTLVNESAMISHSDSTVNLEYLKNIMIRFMNSTSLNEKKALVPVIGAVLELTPDELSHAIDNVEKSAAITGMGTSLIENMQSKGFVGGFFG